MEKSTCRGIEPRVMFEELPVVPCAQSIEFEQCGW